MDERSDDARYRRARERVQQLRGFYIHAMMFVIVNAMLFLLDLLDDSGDWWFFWPLLGWGIGLAAHGATVFAFEGALGRDWEERKIRDLMERDERR